jgi:DNA-binding LytR/AlgR family response regulator
LTAKSMKEWETRLPENYFCRIHRSTIINMEYINRLEEWFNYSYRIYMKGLEDPYLLSRRYVARLKSKMG